MPFGIIGRTGPWIRQVLGFGGRSTGRGTFGARYCNQWGLYGVCVRVPQPSELRCGVVRAVGRGIAVLDWGSTSCKGKGNFGVFVLHFHNGKCHLVADGEMFPICMRKLDNISVWQTCRWKALFVGFLAIYSVSRSKLVFIRN